MARVNQHGLQRFKFKISKMNQRRETVLAIFCISESVELIIPNSDNAFSKIVTPQDAFETAQQINEELVKKDGIRWCILQKIPTFNR